MAITFLTNEDEKKFVKTINGLEPDPETGDVEITIPDSGGNASGGTGLSTTAASLLIEILESAVYSTNVSGKIASLKEALVTGGSSGDGDSGTDSSGETVADEITVSDGVMTIVTVGAEITVSDGVMMIA